MERVLVAMSGGVDSSVAIALLHRAGYQVIGVTMRLSTLEDPDLPGPFRSCCSLEDVDDARAVCQVLGVPHYTLNFEREFEAYVIEAFCQEYARGRTPNPCLLCNQELKFRFLLERAEALGFDKLATGHYARVVRDDQGYHLLRASDPSKDQSYVLFSLGQAQLSRILFPVGEFTKDEVRRIAAEMDLPVADKPDSQDICFIPSGDYRSFLQKRLGAFEPGEIVDLEGRVLGKHRGIPYYTVGQRQGLGLATGERLYVVEIDAANNRLIVGPEEALFATALIAEDVRFTSDRVPEEPLAVSARIRYRTAEVPAEVVGLPGQRALVRFAEPVRAVTPGQAVVFYRGDEVLGGGTISACLRRDSEFSTGAPILRSNEVAHAL